MYGSAKQTRQSVDTIPQLKAEIESLKSQPTAALEVPISSIIPLQLPNDLKQPRLYFDDHKMELLKASIDKYGVLEPVLLRPSQDLSREDTSETTSDSPPSQANLFELISGERRWRCCRALGIRIIPGVVRQMSDIMALETAIVAHLLSEEISPLEQTESILSLLSLRLKLSPDALKRLLYQIKNSQMRGRSHSENPHEQPHEQQIEIVHGIMSEFGMKLSSFVSNRLPLLNLSPPILFAVRAGKLSPTNAVLVNRQSPAFHETLIAQAQGKTKGELVAIIKATIPSGRGENEPMDEISAGKVVSDQIYSRIKFVRKRTDLFNNPEVLHRLAQIDSLLREIESLGEPSF